MRKALNVLTVIAFFSLGTEQGLAQSGNTTDGSVIAASVPTHVTKTIYHDGAKASRDEADAVMKTALKDYRGVVRDLRVEAKVLERTAPDALLVFCIEVYVDHRLVSQKISNKLYGSVAFSLGTDEMLAAEVNARDYRNEMKFVVYRTPG